MLHDCHTVSIQEWPVSVHNQLLIGLLRLVDQSLHNSSIKTFVFEKSCASKWTKMQQKFEEKKSETASSIEVHSHMSKF